jgi:hypothetical protein
MSEPTEILAAVPDGLQYFVNHPPYASDVSTRKRRKTQSWNYGRWVQELPLKYGIWSKKAKHQLWELTLKHIQNDPNFTPQHKSFAAKTLHQVCIFPPKGVPAQVCETSIVPDNALRDVGYLIRTKTKSELPFAVVSR